MKPCSKALLLTTCMTLSSVTLGAQTLTIALSLIHISEPTRPY